MTYTSYALWGRGDVTPQNVSALLADFISEQVGAIFRPVEVPRGGLRNALNWLESPEQWGDGGTIASEDLVTELMTAREAEGDEIVFIALLPADPTPEEVAFVKDVWSRGIPVFDLSAALDLVDIDNLEAVVPEPVKKTRGRKLSDPKPEPFESVTTKATEGPLADELPFESPSKETAATEVVLASEAIDASGPVGLAYEILATTPAPRSWDQYAAESLLAEGLRSIIRQEVYKILTEEGVLNIKSDRDKVDELRDEVTRLHDEELGKAAAKSLKHNADPFAQVTSGLSYMQDKYDKPQFEGPYTGDLTDYYMTPDGDYHLASKGLPKRGWILAKLSDDAVVQLTAAGRIK